MKRPNRVTVVHFSFLAFAVAIVGKAAVVQLWQGSSWQAKADQQHNRSIVLQAPRGQILDASGIVLVETRQMVQLAVAPREVRRDDRARLARALRAAKVPNAVIARAIDTTEKWVVIPGQFLGSQVSGLTSLRGVHSEVALQRSPSPLTGLRGIIGHAAPDGKGIDGIELALDSLLRGIPGKSGRVVDGRRNKLASPEIDATQPVSGHSVVLTLRFDLQDIAERALSDAVRDTRARGGDIVVLDPKRGELLALASRRSDPRATTATALTEPVEPGSTLKPFVAAALLEYGRINLDEVIETHNGTWSLYGIRLTDVHRAPRMTFAQVIEHSSNIGMAKVAPRLTPREEYEALRDFGFGVSTGLPFPSEANGKLYEPKTWSALTPSALARGYEMLATPVQLAVAYGAIANGGELLQPALVKEIRDPDGRTVYKHERQVIRRVISKPVAHQMRKLLRSVVDSGSATRADLATFEVGGKSGTARRTGPDGKYVQGDYTATFVGLFPADDPQLVVLVKLDSPDAAQYYGGQIAAPVTKVVLEAALASSDAALDRSRLRQRPKTEPKLTPEQRIAAVTEPRDSGPPADEGSVTFIATVPAAPPASSPSIAPAVLGPRAVPDVRGLSARDAAAVLHRAGFRVKLVRDMQRGATSPAAGTVVGAGTLIRLAGL